MLKFALVAGIAAKHPTRDGGRQKTGAAARLPVDMWTNARSGASSIPKNLGSGYDDPSRYAHTRVCAGVRVMVLDSVSSVRRFKLSMTPIPNSVRVWNMECPVCRWTGWVEAELVESEKWDIRKICPNCKREKDVTN